MNLRFTYLFRNLTRNTLRSALTVAAVALPVMIFVMTSAVIDGLNVFLERSGEQLRLAVAHKTSIINPLPYGHRAKIESLDPTHEEIRTVVGIAWIGGTIPGRQQPFTTLGVDAEAFPIAFTDHLKTQEERDAWARDRQALIVGNATATQEGWKIGQTVRIQASVPPYSEFQFHIVSIAPEAIDRVANWCHLSYVLEERQKAGFTPTEINHISFFYVKCASLAAVTKYRSRIDELFKNTPDETQTQDEKAFMSQFITQQYNLPRNLAIFSAVTIAVAIMAAANTMNMTFRDRISEFASLKALGFSGSFVAWLIQIESALLCSIGGLLGAFVPFVAFTYTPLRNVPIPLIQVLDIRESVAFLALLVAVGVGVIAALWPAWQARRLHVVSALRNLE